MPALHFLLRATLATFGCKSIKRALVDWLKTERSIERERGLIRGRRRNGDGGDHVVACAPKDFTDKEATKTFTAMLRCDLQVDQADPRALILPAEPAHIPCLRPSDRRAVILQQQPRGHELKLTERQILPPVVG